MIGRLPVFQVEVMIRGASKDSLRMSYMGPTASDPISTAWNTIMVHVSGLCEL